MHAKIGWIALQTCVLPITHDSDTYTVSTVSVQVGVHN